MSAKGLLDPAFQVGTIRLAAFNSRAVPDVVAAVRRLEGAGAAELVLDLRDNRGGLVQEGVELARLFLDGAHAALLSVQGQGERSGAGRPQRDGVVRHATARCSWAAAWCTYTFRSY